ncbi:MAG: UDP-N-acetylmuramate dehydrogenase [Clostridia bacterium]|nr:UDP-N-acetylmuramate dehydrogenase [Clostridia bacterium]
MQNIVEDLLLKDHSTLRVGGIAKRACFPDTVEDLCKAVWECSMENEKFIIVGNCSNIVFPDDGYNGTVIFTYKLKGITVEGTRLTALCGEKLTAVAKAAADASLAGLEFAYGIPGTVGGGVFMNAGAYGGEIKDCLSSVRVLDLNGEISMLPAESLELGYRHSILMEKDLFVLDATFDLVRGDRELIKSKNEENMRKRSDKQPLDMPSCGSVFKRPEGHYAGALIEQCGLKGFSIGGAQVSEKHAGFIVNTGDATAADIENLIKHIQNTVFENTGVTLTPEIRILK